MCRRYREVMHCVLLCKLEAVEGGFHLLELSEVMRCMLLCMLEAVESVLSFEASKFPTRQFSCHSSLSPQPSSPLCSPLDPSHPHK